MTHAHALTHTRRASTSPLKVEHVIREDFNMEALEIVELYCEMLLARFGVIEQMRCVPPHVLTPRPRPTPQPTPRPQPNPRPNPPNAPTRPTP